MEFTTEQLTEIVELWERLCEHPYVNGVTTGYYGSDRHLSSSDPRHGHRMPNAEEIRALVLSDGEETEGENEWASTDTLYPITLTLVSYSDYGGTCADAANVEALRETPGVSVSTGGVHGAGEATVVIGEMSSFANAQGEEPNAEDAVMWLRHLADMMGGLTDYPLISDEEHGKYVDTLADEAWDAYLRSDIESELAKFSPTGEFEYEDVRVKGDPRDGDDIVREAYMSYEDNEWNCETATNVVNARHDDAVLHVAATVLGWNVA